MFDWKKFCQDHSIEFVTEGENVARGNVNISCPYCGDDPSHHMGLSLPPKKPQWGCWRNSRHRGSDPRVLVMRLIGCSIQAATLITADSGSVDDFRKITYTAIPEIRKGKLKPIVLPPSFRRIADSDEWSRVYIEYLRSRGFDNPIKLARDYNLRFTISGPQHHRIIVPVMLEGQTMAYTGRALSANMSPRYLASSTDISTNIKDLLFNYDAASPGGDRLVIVEGPFDALKVDFYLKPRVRAVALASNAVTEAQIYYLYKLIPRFKKTILLLDEDAMIQAGTVFGELSIAGRKLILGALPNGIKDPGEMSPSELQSLPCFNQ